MLEMTRRFALLERQMEDEKEQIEARIEKQKDTLIAKLDILQARADKLSRQSNSRPRSRSCPSAA